MTRLRLVFFLLLFVLSSCVFGQSVLPDFSVTNPGNGNIIISWVNNYDLVKQISIQTSFDSLKNYRTLMSMTDPNSKENGFADTKAMNDHMFYRLFIVKGNGEYFFTTAKKPSIDSFVTVPKEIFKPQTKQPGFVPSFYVYTTNQEGSVYINLPDADKKRYRIKFFEEDDTFLFELKNIKETGLILDKTNFLHAGWFKFELYGDDKLIEKNKFYLSKEF